MLEYISGKLVEKTPTHAIIDCGGVGYFLNISVHTSANIGTSEFCKLFVHEVIREDVHDLYGFSSHDERWVFRKLISVSGVGANTGRMILSSLSPDEIRSAILHENVNTIKGIKGIGAKTAQRIIVDLRDKIGLDSGEAEKIFAGGNTAKQDALTALSSLGFDKAKAEKTLDKIILAEGDAISVEDLLKQALKQL